MTRGSWPERPGRFFSEELLDEIRDKTDIVAVIGEYVPLRRRGSNYVGLCPFHNEKTPSFTVSPDKQMYYCFGCQTGGNVFTFLMQREGLEFTEAVEQLAARAGVPLPERKRGPAGPAERTAEERNRRERDLLYRVVDFASRFYHHVLVARPEGEKARRYLARRGIKPESWETFRLGCSPPARDVLAKALKAKNVPEEVIQKAGLALGGAAGLRDRFRGRLMFTISDRRGRPIGFGARALDDDDEPKYLNSPETPLFEKSRALYAADLAAASIRRGRRVLVVEGYMDAIACHELGFDFTVASMGTALTPEQARWLRRLTDTVITAFDADSAGTQATVRGLEVLSRAGFRVKVAGTPGGKDPDECLRAPGGPETFRRALEEAVPLAEWRFRLALERHDPSTIEGRVRVVEEIVPVLAGLENSVERAEYMRDFAGRLGVAEDALRAELARYRETAAGGRRRRPVGDSIKTLRNNKAARPAGGSSGRSGARLTLGGARDPVRAAERALLACMASSHENLALALELLAEADRWCGDLGLGDAAAAPPGGGETTAGAQDEVAASAEDNAASSVGPVSTGDDSDRPVLNWFSDPAHRRVVRALLSEIGSGRAGGGPGWVLDPARLVDIVSSQPGVTGAGETSPEDARALAKALFEAQPPPADDLEEARRVIEDCLRWLKEHRLNSRIEDLCRRISELERREAELKEGLNEREGGFPEQKEELERVQRILSELFRELIDLKRHADGGTGHWQVPGD